MSIKIETFENQIIQAELITLIELNKIARNNCIGLTYLMNVMDTNSNINQVYMWFKDDTINISYLVKI